LPAPPGAGAPPAGGLLFEGTAPPFAPPLAPELPGAVDEPELLLDGLLAPGRLDGMFELLEGLVADGDRWPLPPGATWPVWPVPRLPDVPFRSQPATTVMLKAIAIASNIFFIAAPLLSLRWVRRPSPRPRRFPATRCKMGATVRGRARAFNWLEFQQT
jgi:hypothetical protein